MPGEQASLTEKVLEDQYGGKKPHVVTTYGLVVSQSPAVRMFEKDMEATDSDLVYQRLKLCKRGYREAMVARVCGVRFEGLPMWLWTIRLAEWSTIYITGTDEVLLRQYHVATWEYVKPKLVLIDEVIDRPLPEVDLWMISGTLKFIGSVAERLREYPRVFWMSDGGRRTPKTVLLGVDWKMITHAQVGGVTKASGIFVTAGIDGLDVNDDPIRRTMGHVIK
jgi:hypothetical protein